MFLWSHSLIVPSFIKTAAALHNQLHKINEMDLHWDGVPMPDEEDDFDGIADVFNRIEADEDSGLFVPRATAIVHPATAAATVIGDQEPVRYHSHGKFKRALIGHFHHEWFANRIVWPKRFPPE